MSLSLQTRREQRRYLRVDSRTRLLLPDLKELWSYREMLVFLVSRDVKVRYRQTLLGAAWAIIQPLTSMIVFTIVFGGFAKVPSNGIPYPLFAFAGIVPWTLFANIVSSGSESLVAQSQLVRKVYFPRIFIPFSRIMSIFVDFVIALVILLIMLVYFTFSSVTIRPLSDEFFSGRVSAFTQSFSTSPLAIVVIPLLAGYIMFAGLAMTLWLSALNVSYRDIRYLVPFGMQLLTYLSPVAYSSGLVPAEYRILYNLNPMASVIEAFRWVLLGQHPPSMAGFLLGGICTIVLFVTGLLYFTYVEGTFADII